MTRPSGSVRQRRTILAVVGLLLLLATAAIVIPQSNDSADKSSSREGSRQTKLSGNQALLSGMVTDQETKKPVRGAVIEIDHARGPTTVRTSIDGRYKAVVDASRPIALTVDAPGHKGAAAFGKLCAKERRDLPVALAPAASPGAPAAPQILAENCG